MSRLVPYRDKRGNWEKGIYEDPNSGRKYLRIRDGGGDTFRSCGTDKISVAINERNAREAAKAAARLGIAIEPSVNERKAKQAEARATTKKVIKTYVEAGYPDRKGIPRNPHSRHGLAEVGYCDTLLTYFRGEDLAEELDQDALDNYHDWRVFQSQPVPCGFNRHRKQMN